MDLYSLSGGYNRDDHLPSLYRVNVQGNIVIGLYAGRPIRSGLGGSVLKRYNGLSGATIRC